MASSASDSAPTPGQASLALLIIRIAAGLVFLYHGSAIFFGAFGGPGPQGFAEHLHAPDIVGLPDRTRPVRWRNSSPDRDLHPDRSFMHHHRHARRHLSWCICHMDLTYPRADANSP